MIPRIVHSRSKLVSYINDYDDGAMSFFVLAPEQACVERFYVTGGRVGVGWRLGVAVRRRSAAFVRVVVFVISLGLSGG